MSTCPDRDTLEAFLAGPGDTAVAAHVDTCPACQSRLDALTTGPAAPPADAFAAEPALGRAVGALLARPAHPDAVGPFRVCEVIGRGGMGTVYRGRDDRLGRDVAVKVLHPHLAADGPARFRREGEAAAAVRHENVVVVHDLGARPDGAPFLVMEYVPGGTLRDCLRAGPLPPREAAELVAQAAAGVHAAHAAGVLHRDVKPSNVLIDAATGRAKVTDFGLARPLSPAEPLTTRGDVVGTPAYMAPEQVATPDRLDARTDVYGLGATLYEALTGAVPFRGSVQLVLKQVLDADPLPPRRLNPGVPRDLETVCLKCLQKDPARRYGTAAELSDDLRRWRRGEPIRARPVGAAARAARWARRNPLPAGLGGALVAVVAVAFVGITTLWLKADASATAERAERAQADDDYRRAERVVERFASELYREGTLAAPVSLETRRELVREAIRFREEVARRRPAETPAAELAAGYARLGWLSSEMRDHAAGLAAYRTAATHFAALPDRKQEYAECQYHLGRMAMWVGDAAAAERASAACVELTGGPYRAAALSTLGLVRSLRGDGPGAVGAYREARDLLAAARAAEPKSAGHLQDLFWATVELGEARPDPAAAVADLRAADQLAAEYAKRNPTDYNGVKVQCAARARLAGGFVRAGRPAEALAAATAAVAAAAKMAKFPPPFDAPGYQAAAHAALGDAKAATGDTTAADSWRTAAAVYAPLPRTTVFHHAHAARYADVCRSLATVGDAAAARQAAELRAELRAVYPDNPRFRD